MLPRTTSLVLAAASDNNVAQNQTPGAAGNLTLNGALVVSGVATFDVARRVLVTTASDESAKTLTITGTSRDGRTITETMTGPNATTGFTDQDFKTVTQVAVSAAFTGNVKVGTNGVGSSRWVGTNVNAPGFEVGVQVKVTGTVNYTVEATQSDLMGGYPAGGGQWAAPGIPLAIADQFLVGQSQSGQTLITMPSRAVRVTLNSGTGTVELTVTQSGGL